MQDNMPRAMEITKLKIYINLDLKESKIYW